MNPTLFSIKQLQISSIDNRMYKSNNEQHEQRFYQQQPPIQTGQQDQAVFWHQNQVEPQQQQQQQQHDQHQQFVILQLDHPQGDLGHQNEHLMQQQHGNFVQDLNWTHQGLQDGGAIVHPIQQQPQQQPQVAVHQDNKQKRSSECSDVSSDEGYRSSPKSSASSVTSSPNIRGQVQGFPQHPYHNVPVTSAAGTANPQAVAIGGEEQTSNNLMWLLDFKLDFFNDGQQQQQHQQGSENSNQGKLKF